MESQNPTASAVYLRNPALSPDGSQIAFCHAGDIWMVASEGGDAHLLTSHASYDQEPRFSPCGKWVAFVSHRTGNGDVYVISLETGELRQITCHDDPDILCCWSFDGQWIYFNSWRNGTGLACHKVRVKGGTPIRVMGEAYEAFYNVAISPDGKTLAFNNNGHQWWRHGPNPSGASDIWLVSEAPNSSDFRKINSYKGRNLWPMWDATGSGIYFVSDQNGSENIYYQKLHSKEIVQITHFTQGRVIRPSISYDRRLIVFERDFGIWKLELPSSQKRGRKRRAVASPIPIRVRSDRKIAPTTRSYDGNLDEFELSPDGKKVAFAVRGEIFAVPAEKGGEGFRLTNTPFREGQISWSPDSRRIVYLSDRCGENQVFLYDFVAHKETQLTTSSAPKSNPKFSPDGEWVSFFYGQNEIRLVELKTLSERQFIRATFLWGVDFPSSYAWSPDSQWVAFIAQDQNYFSNLYLQKIDSETASQITFLSNIHGHGVIWSSDGKYIIFNTGQYREEWQIARVDLIPLPPTFREDEFDKLFDPKPDDDKPESQKQADASGEKGDSEGKKKKPEPVEIELQDIKHRIRLLTPFKLNATAMQISPDSKTLIFQARILGQESLFSLSFEVDKQDDPPKQIVSTKGHKSSLFFLPDGKKIYYLDGGKVYARPFPDGDPAAIDTKAEVEVDFHKEKLQMFDEAWKLMRDHFYDQTFNNRDWEAIRHKFRPIADSVHNQTDFHEVINLMVGELNASHLGVGAGSGEFYDGYLGLQFDRYEQETTGRLKISAIVPRSPATLSKDPIQMNDYLLAIDGVTLDETVNLDQLLSRKIGKKVELRVNDKPQLEGSKRVEVKPVNAGAFRDLCYRAWAQKNSDYVHKKSDGRLGYVHIRDMAYGSYVQFLVDLDTEAHNREGVLIDVRFNGGGHIAPFILDVLHRKGYAISTWRDQVASVDTNIAGNRILAKPTILLVNEHSGSNAEMFTEGYKRLGLGKVVGTPTAGAVIWTWGWQLLDGSSFRLPRLRVSTLDGENLEGKARQVDYQVHRPLGEEEQGKDSQLDVAIEKLTEQIGAKK